MKILFATIFMTFLLTGQAKAEEGVAGISLVLDTQDEIPSLQEMKIEKAIIEYSQFYEVDADLIRAIISCESEGRIKAFNINNNGTKDYGLMQINSCNHDWLEDELGITDFYDIDQNIHCGVYMIADLMKRHSDYHEILMCYNMGEKRTKELHQDGIYSSTYSRKVLKKYEEIKEE